jgi:penicillin-binding protein 1A
MDADSGHVLALTGGYSHGLSQFNSATQALRQTGSAFKPIVYAAALEHGFQPDSIIDDKPIAYDLGPGYGTYVPKNYAKRSYGPTPLHDGIIYSRNRMTVNLAARMGMGHVQTLAQNLGVVEAMPPHLSMSLGAGETSVLRLAAAYATLVNGGRKVPPTVIHTIYDHVGKKLEQTQPCFGLSPSPYAVLDWDKQGKHMETQINDLREALLSPSTSQAMTTMLRQTVEKGTARQLAVAAQTLPLILGGKTGTTNDFKDAWFVGFAENSHGRRLVVAVFVGYPYPKSLGQDENGSHVALPIFELFIHKAQGAIQRF